MKQSEFVPNLATIFSNQSFKFFKTFKIVLETDSTNRYAKQFLENNPLLPAFILAGSQTTGRGRFDRQWNSCFGGIYISCIQNMSKNQEMKTLFPLMYSIAVAKTLRKYGISASIKWPNDVLIQGKKIAGILVESYQTKINECLVIGGIGLNVLNDLSVNVDTYRIPATSVAHEIGNTIDFNQVLLNLLHEIEILSQNFVNHDYELIRNQWRRYSDTISKMVTIKEKNQSIVGKAIDITKEGFLSIAVNDTEKKIVITGDCSYQIETM